MTGRGKDIKKRKRKRKVEKLIQKNVTEAEEGIKKKNVEAK